MTLSVLRTRHLRSFSISWQYVHCTEAMLLFDVVINWLVTLLIIWKLYRVGHRAMNLTGQRSNKYLRIILSLVESGILLSVTIGVYAALWIAGLVSALLRPNQ